MSAPSPRNSELQPKGWHGTTEKTTGTFLTLRLVVSAPIPRKTMQQVTTRKNSPAPQARRGSALLMGVALITMISALVLGYLTTAASSQKWANQQDEERRVDSAAEDAISLAIHQVWSEFTVAYAGRRTTHWDVKFYLDSMGILDQSAAPDPAVTDRLILSGLPLDEDGATSMHDCLITSLNLWRIDGRSSVQLFVEVEAQAGGMSDKSAARRRLRRTLRQSFLVDGKAWDGLDYAMLANNINCIMCHTTVTDVGLQFNTDEADYGSFERVKVGSLESFQLREDPDSWVAGTLYMAGKGIDSDGDLLENWHEIGMKSRAFGADGLIDQDTWGNLTTTDLIPADPFFLTEMANLYLDYGDPDLNQIDGFLPSAFPSPFPDDGGFDFDTGGPIDGNEGNRILDDSEFYAIARLATGTLAGGTISVSPEGNTVATNDALTAMTSAGTTPSLNATTDGNVYLHGTEANPILLSGDVAIKGDVILSGVVKGEGTLLISGNVYIPGDLTYQDGATGLGDRTFGVASDGATNTLAIASGGNVIVGDVFRPTWGSGDAVTGNPDGDFNFILEELALFNRTEWLKTQETLYGKSTKVQNGTKEVTKQSKEWVEYATPIDVEKNVYENQPYTVDVEVPVYEWVEGYKILTGYVTETQTKNKWVVIGTETVQETGSWVYTPYTETVPTYTWVKEAYVNPYFEGSEYLPRYYSFDEDSVVPIFNKDGHYDPVAEAWIADERPKPWSSSDLTLADPTDPDDPTLYNADGTPRAVITTITASANWITDEMLRELMTSSLASRDAATALQIDATIYSNNSIFGIVPSRGSPGTNGELIVNGAIVAADIGLLAPGGFDLRYDRRGGERLDIRADTQISLRRQLLVTSARP